MHLGHRERKDFVVYIIYTPQFPWHWLTKRGIIERKNRSYDIFSGVLGSSEVNHLLLSFSFLSSRSNALSKSGFMVHFLPLGFLPLDFGLSNWSSKVGLYLLNYSTYLIRASGSIECYLTESTLKFL